MDESYMGILFAAILIQMIAIYDNHNQMNRMEAMVAASISAQQTLTEHIQAQFETMAISDKEAKTARQFNVNERRAEYRDIVELLQMRGFHYLLPKRRIPPMLP